MPRQHYPNTLIFLMIFSLVSLQIYPLGFALAADPGAEVSSDDSADKTADKTESDKKDSAKKEETKTAEKVAVPDEQSDDEKKTEKRETDAEKTDAEDADQKEEALAASETVDAETVDEKAVPEVTAPAALAVPAKAEPAADATEQADTTENTPSEEVGASLPDADTPIETLPVSVPSSETEGTTDSAPSLAVKTNPETAVNDLPLANDSSAGDNGEVAVVSINDTTLENVSATSADTGGNGTEAVSSEQPSALTSEDVPEALSSDQTEATQEETLPPVEVPTDSAVIATGDAASVTVIKNNLNTNVTTENGSVSNTDIYDYTGDIDLLAAFVAVLAGAKQAAVSNNDAINLVIQNINQAVVTNSATSVATSGSNSANGESASIVTGAASATTDIVNYINTNIVGNNWLYATLNIFGNWTGNLIVPGEGLLNVPTARNFLALNILNENSVDVTNVVSTVANTGGNNVTGSGAGETNLETGTAVAQTNVNNIVNTNIVRNNWFMLLFNNMGNWTGQLLNWGGETSGVLAYNLGSVFTSVPVGSLSVSNQNEAQVFNSVATTANSGNNSASGNAGNVSVSTGNASAFSNIFNMINTNIVGDNWFFGVVNNMGNWQGNVEFGYPDLAVALVADKAAVSPGETVDFTVHYKNLGSADSGDTQVRLNLPAELSAEKTSWAMPGLKAGEEGSLDLKAQVKDDASAGKILESTVSISTETKEVNLENNSDSDETGVYDVQKSEEDELNSNLVVKRNSTATDQVKPGDRVQNTITVENKSDNSLYNVSVSDKMLITDGTKLANFVWPIGKIKKGARVTIQYEFIVNNPGQVVAVNYVAKATGQDLTGKDVASHKASDWLTVLGFVSSAYAASDQETPTVAGAETHSDTPAGSVLQDAPAVPLGWPLWLWLVSVSAYLLDALRTRLTLTKRLTG